jgi:branched-chain amino acid transport system substrate-binding protein
LPPRASGDSPPRASGATARRVFRLAGRDDRQGEAAALWLAGAAPERRIAFIRDGSRYARDLAERAEKIWRGNGTASAPLFAIETGREDYSDVAARVAALKPEAVFFAGFPMEAAIFLKGLRRAGQSARFLGSDSLAGDIFGGAAGPEPENVRVLLPNDPAPREGWRPQEIADLNRYPEASRGFMGRTYGAIEAWAEAARRSGSLTPDAVSAALMAGPIETAALGPISFDENGDARVPSYAAAHWNGMHWVPGD